MQKNKSLYVTLENCIENFFCETFAGTGKNLFVLFDINFESVYSSSTAGGLKTLKLVQTKNSHKIKVTRKSWTESRTKLDLKVTNTTSALLRAMSGYNASSYKTACLLSYSLMYITDPLFNLFYGYHSFLFVRKGGCTQTGFLLDIIALFGVRIREALTTCLSLKVSLTFNFGGANQKSSFF